MSQIGKSVRDSQGPPKTDAKLPPPRIAKLTLGNREGELQDIGDIGESRRHSGSFPLRDVQKCSLAVGIIRAANRIDTDTVNNCFDNLGLYNVLIIY